MYDKLVRNNAKCDVTQDYLALTGAANTNKRLACPDHFSRPIQERAAPLREKWQARDNCVDDDLRQMVQHGLLGLAAHVNFCKQNTLFNQSESDPFVYLVTDGVVCLHRTFADGRRYVMDFALPGDFIGLWSDQTARPAAQALGPVGTLRIAHDEFAEFLEISPDIKHRIRLQTSHELTLACDRMAMLARFSAREKLASFLLLMRQRWRHVNGQSIHVSLPMSRQDIADFLGLTTETVSRTISTFSRERVLVVVPDGVRLLDVPKLKAITQSCAGV